MSTIVHTRARLILALFISVALVISLGPALISPSLISPADAAEFHEQGCYADPAGDAGGVDAADLLEVCINHNSNGRIAIIVGVAGAIDPAGDPAWANDGTQLSAMLSTDGDSSPEVVLTLHQVGGVPRVDATNGSGTPIPDCAVNSGQNGPNGIFLLVLRTCLDDPQTVRTGAMLTYEETDGAAVAMDRTPDDDLSNPGLATGDSPPFCDVHSESGDAVIIARLRCGGVITGTEPISQAIAVSQFVFDDFDTPEIDPYRGDWAVLVRDDNFADALAGSSLGFGQAPLLFTYSPTSGPALSQDPTRLASATRQELLRTVPRGYTVYVLGGTAAIDPGVVTELEGLGYVVRRLSGPSREETAAAVAREVRVRVTDFAARNPGFVDTNMVLVANRDNWPDAVLAGQVGALWGFPVVLTSADSLHPATKAVLDEIRPNSIQLIGGPGVLTSRMLNEEIRANADAMGYGMGPAGVVTESDDENEPWRQFCARSDTERFHICRQGGANRIETAAAVSQFGREMIQRFGGPGTLVPDEEIFASGVPIGGGLDSDNYAYVLAASMMSGRFGGAVFLPTEAGELSGTIKASVCDFRRFVDTNGDGVADTPFIERVGLVALMADTDKLPDSFGEEIRALIQDNGCEGFTNEPTFASAD